MNTSEEVTKTILEHIDNVRYWMDDIARQLIERGKTHDKSKLQEPEKSMFDEFAPKLKATGFGSDEYKKQLEQMGETLKLHYKRNRHHPEHFENGINGMSLIDIIEMVCDWMAAAQAKDKSIDMDYLCERFGISEQLRQIISNTLMDTDFWNEVNGCPVINFSREHWSEAGRGII